MPTAVIASLAWSAPDVFVAGWFHQRLTPTFADILFAMSEPGSAGCVTALFIGIVLLLWWKRLWRPMVNLLLVLPLGALGAELIKLIVRRDRPYLTGPFGAWGGYSFPSGHTTAATLLYGCLLLMILPLLARLRWRMLATMVAMALIACVGFSRIALGAHYLTDVLGAMTLSAIWLAICYVLLRRPASTIVLPQTPSVSP